MSEFMRYKLNFSLFLLLASIICINGFSQSLNYDSVKIKEMSYLPVENYELQISQLLYIQPVENFFVIVHRNKNGISVMNKQGELISHLGRSGRGPFEWQRPSFIQYQHGEITIWDAGNLKFLVYDENLEPLREVQGIQYSISGFNKKDRNLLSTYMQPGTENEFVYIHEKESESNYKTTESLGSITEEGRQFLFMEMMGGVIWNFDDLLWVDSSVPGFFIYDSKDKKTEKVNFEDELFSVDEWTGSSEMTAQSMSKLEDYFFSNSRIVSIQKIKDHILLEVEHFPVESSIINYHLFDLEYNYVTKLEAGDGGWMNYIRGVNDNQLYYWGDDYFKTGLNGSIRVREIVFE